MSEAPASGAGLGDLLRDARLRAGLELSDVAAATHVRRTYLEALENEAFDALPEDVYARNFLRLYARAVDVDPDDALARFDAARNRTTRPGRTTRSDARPPTAAGAEGAGEAGSSSGGAPNRSPAAARAEAAEPPRARRGSGAAAGAARVRRGLPPNLMPLLMTIVLAGALVGVAVWGFNQLLFRPERTLAGPQSTPPAPADEGGGAGAPAGGVDTPAGAEPVPPPQGGLAAPALPGGDALPDEILLSVTSDPPGAEVTVDAFPLPGTTPIRDVPISAREERTLRLTREGHLPYEGTFDMTSDRDLSISLEEIPAEEGADVPEAPLPEGDVVIEVTEPTWLEAYQSTARGEGQRLVYTTAQPGERFAFSRPLYLYVGNAGGLDVSVDGEPFGPLGSGGAVTGQAFPAR